MVAPCYNVAPLRFKSGLTRWKASETPWLPSAQLPFGDDYGMATVPQKCNASYSGWWFEPL